MIPFSVTEGISKYNIQSLYPIDITDLDGDGFTFIEEEARLDRRIQSTFPPGPRFTVETSGSHEFPYITFETVTGGQTIGNAGYYTSNLLYEVQRSTDLNTWTSAGIILEDTFGINGRRITQYRTSTPLSDSSKQFLRVSVRRP